MTQVTGTTQKLELKQNSFDNEQMKKQLLALFLLMIPQWAFSSYFESCQLQVEVVSGADKDYQLKALEIIKSEDGSHGDSNCKGLLGKTHQVKLDQAVDWQEGSTNRVRFLYDEGLTPTGLVFTKRWIVIKK